jgi:hypothetical protein
VPASSGAFEDARLEDEILDAGETAETLNISKFTLLRMRKLPDGGGLPWVRLGMRRVGYRRADVRAYLLARRQGSLPEKPDAEQRRVNPDAQRGSAYWIYDANKDADANKDVGGAVVSKPRVRHDAA